MSMRNTAAVLGRNGPKYAPAIENPVPAVQIGTGGKSPEMSGNSRSGDSDLDSVETVAAELGIEPKRLRGFILRNQVGDPIGNMNLVYRSSCATLRKRLAQPITVSIPDVR